MRKKRDKSDSTSIGSNNSITGSSFKAISSYHRQSTEHHDVFGEGSRTRGLTCIYLHFDAFRKRNLLLASTQHQITGSPISLTQSPPREARAMAISNTATNTRRPQRNLRNRREIVKPVNDGYQDLFDPNGSHNLLISIDLCYSNVSRCWRLVPGEQKAAFLLLKDMMKKAETDYTLGREDAVVALSLGAPHQEFNGKHFILEFGNAAEAAVIEKGARPFRSVKQSLIPEGSPLLASTAKSSWYSRAQELHNTALKAIDSSISTCVSDALTGELSEVEVNSTCDIMVQLLRNQLQLVKKEIMQEANFTDTQVDQVLSSKRARVAVDSTTAHGEDSLDLLRCLCERAGFPENTRILSEAKSAAIYSVLHSKNLLSAPLATEPRLKLRGKHCMVVDIGGGTTDIAVIQVVSMQPTLDIREVFEVKACMSGSNSLNDTAASHIRRLLGDEWSDFFSNNEMTEDKLLETIRTEFEFAKQDFDPSTFGCRKHFIYSVANTPKEFGEILSKVHLSSEYDTDTMQMIFEDWLRDIITQVNQQLLRLSSHSSVVLESTGEIPIILTGRGANPKFVQQHMQSTLSNPILTINPDKCSSVCYGGFVSMLNDGLPQQLFARYSCGFIAEEGAAIVPNNDKPSANNGPASLQTPIWLVRKGDVISPETRFHYEGMIRIENQNFP
ncbi:hypothetical protein LTR84_011741 [Exophiala bonariae]|uniref:Hydantoinase A/oxoprolinase domain-containing protein n=1 Tax=Exophiala bonariae TaxID=1690606 RepID=A0AAV9NIF4_9EURO|nr:hypothetical protein LTR84_011741 [Exophiala bonariae]